MSVLMAHATIPVTPAEMGSFVLMPSVWRPLWAVHMTDAPAMQQAMSEKKPWRRWR